MAVKVKARSSSTSVKGAKSEAYQDKTDDMRHFPSPRDIEAYAKIIQRYDLSEIEIVSADLSLVLRGKKAEGLVGSPLAGSPALLYGHSLQHAGQHTGASSVMSSVGSAVVPSPLSVPPKASDTSEAFDESTLLRAKMLGTIYVSRQPGSAPFVTVGSQVKAGDVVLIIEAMKVMNQVLAHRDGVVKKMMVSDGDPVEFGQPLLVIA